MSGVDSEKQTLPGRIAGLTCLERIGIRAIPDPYIFGKTNWKVF